MREKIFYQIGRALLFGIALFAILALAPGGSIVAKALDEPEMPPSDARVLPASVKARGSMAELYFAAAPDPSYAPGYYDTSVYMLGDVAVGIILPESNGNGESENWTEAEKNNVVSEIQAGLNWWKTAGGDLANLNFEYDIHFDVSTTYEPITRTFADEGLWISQAMSNLGYTTGDYFEQVYAYNNYLRNQYQTDWAFTIFVVDSSNDADGKFADGNYFAYSYLGGPFTVMTYDNATWGIDRMDRVTAHEAGHIFLAGDQYYDSSCDITDRFGYLGIENDNCDNINNGLDDGEPSVMKRMTDPVFSNYSIDSYAREQIGWRDSDFDDIPDILDTVPVVTLDSYSPNPTVNRTLSYNGYVKNPVYPHAVCSTGDWCYFKDVTTQSIDRVNYQVDSGAWNAAIAQDGAFDSDVEDFSFTTTSLTPGNHSIKLESINSSGNVSTTWSDTVLVNAPAPAVGSGIYDDAHAAWTYSGSWSVYSGAGPYNNSLRYTSTVGNYAEITFTGTQFTFKYLQHTNRGLIDVYVDGVKVDTINANGATTWQQSWTSASYPNGDHTVRFVHAGGGTYVDIDVIEIFGPPAPVVPGIYDDTHVAWKYNGLWSTYSGAGPYDNGLSYTSTVGDYAEITFTGTQFTLTYLQHTNRGKIDVYVDWVKVDTINAYGLLAWQQSWTSAIYALGDHTVRFVHAGEGTYIDVDAIEIIGPDVTAPAAISDLSAVTGGAGGSVDLSWTAVGDDGGTGTATSYLVRYSTSAINDETDWNNATVFTNSLTPQEAGKAEKLTVTGLTPGTTYFFAVRAQDEKPNLGGLSNSPSAAAKIPLPPVGSGIYDDTHAAWVFSGTWAVYSGAGPYDNSLHYTSTVGDYAEIPFTGTQFTLKYLQYTNRGKIDVYVDGVKVDTIDEKGPLAWQQSWNSATYPNGDHIVRFMFAGEGTYVDIDVIEIVGPDVTAPAAITDLNAVTGGANGSVDLSWTAVGDDGSTGTATSYLVRYSLSEINNETDWNNAAVFTNTLTPQEAGQVENLTVIGLTPGATYFFAVRAQDESPNLGALSNSPNAASKYVPPPPNDDFDNAIPIESLTFPVTIDVVSASDHPDDPDIEDCELVPNGYSVWYKYTPPSNGIITIDTVGSDYDTVVALWTGTRTNLQPVACNDDLHGVTLRANLAAYVSNGTEYYIEIDQSNRVPSPSPSQSGAMEAPTLDKALVLNVTFTPYDAPHGSGKYDDRHAGWMYNGAWVPAASNDAYNSTFTYSGTVGDNAIFIMEGNRFTLTYRQHPLEGVLDVYVDGVRVHSLDQNGELQWQTDWTSADLGNGIHTIRFVNVGGVGPYVVVDAITVFEPPVIVGLGIYDDTHAAWNYSGSWSTYSGAGPYDNSLSYTSTVGDYAEVKFIGQQFTLTYTQNTNRTTMDVYVDGVKVDTIDEKGPLAWQQSWTSANYALGEHTVRFVHAGNKIVDVDAIEILGQDTTAPAAITDLNAVTGAAGGSVDLSWTAVGDDGGTGTVTSYLVRYSLSAINNDTDWNNATVFANTLTPQEAGQSENLTVTGLTPGTTYFFAVRAQDEIPNLGGVSNSPSAEAKIPPPPVGAGIYDDTDTAWVYNGSWAVYSGAGPYNNGLSYTSTSSDYAEITFTGTQFTLKYLQNTNRGRMDVYVDGVKVDTINQFGLFTWQKSWTSASYALGDHTARFVHAGGGTYVDVDAIEIIP